MKMREFWLKFHWSLFLWVWLTIGEHWFRYWLCAEQATSHYLNRWVPSLPTHICGTRKMWVLTEKCTFAYNVEFFRGSQLTYQNICFWLTHWGQVTHIYVGNLTIIGSDNGLSPGRRQAIIWTSAEILLIGPLETCFSEILIGIQTFSFKKMHLKMSSAKWRPFCLGLNVLRYRVAAEHARKNITYTSDNPVHRRRKASLGYNFTNLWSK